jgi:hypothetical protein
VKKTDVEVIGWHGYTWSAVVKAGWTYCQLTLEEAFRVAFYCPHTRCTCVMIMLFNLLLDVPYLSDGWIIFAKGEMLTNRDLSNFVNKI